MGAWRCSQRSDGSPRTSASRHIRSVQSLGLQIVELLLEGGVGGGGGMAFVPGFGPNVALVWNTGHQTFNTRALVKHRTL